MKPKFTETHRQQLVMQLSGILHDMHHLTERVDGLMRTIAGLSIEMSADEVEENVNRLLLEKNYVLVLRDDRGDLNSQLGTALVINGDLNKGFQFVPFPSIAEDQVAVALIKRLLKDGRVDWESSTPLVQSIPPTEEEALTTLGVWLRELPKEESKAPQSALAAAAADEVVSSIAHLDDRAEVAAGLKDVIENLTCPWENPHQVTQAQVGGESDGHAAKDDNFSLEA